MNKEVIAFILCVVVEHLYYGVAFGVGFSVAAKCEKCGKEYEGLKVKALADEGLEPYIQRYCEEREMGKL